MFVSGKARQICLITELMVQFPFVLKDVVNYIREVLKEDVELDHDEEQALKMWSALQIRMGVKRLDEFNLPNTFKGLEERAQKSLSEIKKTWETATKVCSHLEFFFFS